MHTLLVVSMPHTTYKALVASFCMLLCYLLFSCATLHSSMVGDSLLPVNWHVKDWGQIYTFPLYEPRSAGIRIVRFQLPLGGELNPEPDGTMRRDGTIGGVAFDTKPQGRELASLVISISVRRYDNAEIGRTTFEDYFDYLEQQTARSDNRRISKKSRVEINGRNWLFREYVSTDSKQVSFEEYALDLTEGQYLSVVSMLSRSFSVSRERVEASHGMLREAVHRVQVERRR